MTDIRAKAGFPLPTRASWRRRAGYPSPVNSERLTPKALALACLVALIVVFVLEAIPHQHASAADRGCPACQAARQHVGDAPRATGAVLSAPTCGRPQTAEPAIERLAVAPSVSSASPRAPPSAA